MYAVRDVRTPHEPVQLLNRFVIVLMLAAGCANHRPEATQYATTHADRIVNTTRPLWIKSTALHQQIEEADYTPDIRALKPSLVAVARHGVYLYIHSVPWNVTGIFIRYDPAFPTPSTRPPDSDQMTYERLAPDVFWFSMPK